MNVMVQSIYYSKQTTVLKVDNKAQWQHKFLSGYLIS